MTHRAYRNHGEEIDLALYNHRRETVPNADPRHKGLCICGTETTRYKTVGPPGHPLNGWQCRACNEAEMAAIFNRAVRK